MDGAHELAPEIRHEEKIENSAPKKFGSAATAIEYVSGEFLPSIYIKKRSGKNAHWF
jgi:hypothetical protein